MALELLREQGMPIGMQRFDWRDLVRTPMSKLDDHVFTRVRLATMIALEREAARFQHLAASVARELREPLARVRRVEQHQQSLLRSLLPPDLSPLETLLTFAHTELEMLAHVAQHEDEPEVERALRFLLAEQVDQLFRVAVLLDRIEGKDANTLLQSAVDLREGRPTALAHRPPEQTLLSPHHAQLASPMSRLGLLIATACAQATHDQLLLTGAEVADPLARLVLAELASVKEQHLTALGALADPQLEPLEAWLLHEAAEVYGYYSCGRHAQHAHHGRLRALWQRLLDYELGHLHVVVQLLRDAAGADPTGASMPASVRVLPMALTDLIAFESHRDFIAAVLREDADLALHDGKIGPRPAGGAEGDAAALAYRTRLHARGVPSDIVAQGYVWRPGGELARSSSRSSS